MKLKTKKTEAACWRGAYQVLLILAQNESMVKTRAVTQKAALRIEVSHKARDPVRSIEERGIQSLLILGFIDRPKRGYLECTQEGIDAVKKHTEDEILSLLLLAHGSHALNYYLSIAENNAEVQWMVERLQRPNQRNLFSACFLTALKKI